MLGVDSDAGVRARKACQSSDSSEVRERSTASGALDTVQLSGSRMLCLLLISIKIR